MGRELPASKESCSVFIVDCRVVNFIFFQELDQTFSGTKSTKSLRNLSDEKWLLVHFCDYIQKKCYKFSQKLNSNRKSSNLGNFFSEVSSNCGSEPK